MITAKSIKCPKSGLECTRISRRPCPTFAVFITNHADEHDAQFVFSLRAALVLLPLRGAYGTLYFV